MEDFERCVLCGAVRNTKPDAGLASRATASGAPALDLRPAELGLRELAGWVCCCSSCGYCNTALDDLPDESCSAEQLAAKVRGGEYERTLHDARFPPLASRFRCQALLQQMAAAPAGRDLAALSILYAAWACDDIADGELPESAIHSSQAAALARQLRRQAAELLRDALEAGRVPLEDAGTCWLVLSDVYRRAESFPSAHTAAVRGLAELEPASPLVALLRLEQQLVEAQQTQAVRMDAAFSLPDG